MDLRTIKKHLEKEGFTTSLEPATEDAPLDQLFVLLQLDEPEVELILELAYVPGIEDELDDIKLLQFYAGLPFAVDEASIDRWMRLVLKSNLALPMMGFGINEEDGYLYFRFVLPLPKKPSNADRALVVQSAWMVFFLVERFYPVFAADAEAVS